MKKTIAILLVLVIGMAGVFAVEAIPNTASDNATITINTDVAAYAAFGLTSSTATALTKSAVASLSAFNTATEDTVAFNSTDMNDFVVGPTVGYLHGISNYLQAITLNITVDPFTTTDDANASIPLTVSPTTYDIPAVSEGVRGYFLNQPITVTADLNDVDTAPASNEYTSTVYITVSTT
jgi:hypothetical protein